MTLRDVFEILPAAFHSIIDVFNTVLGEFGPSYAYLAYLPKHINRYLHIQTLQVYVDENLTH